MDAQAMLFNAVGGLGLFLVGMGMLSEGLKRVAGGRLRRLLEAVTRRPLVAMLAGAGVTCLIQSSSATTVIVVGLVNAGLLTLRQAICVIFGANVGTTFTAWLVGLAAGLKFFKITSFALPAVAIGFLLEVVGRRARVKHLGRILTGFGILFLGIHFMKDGFAPLKDSAAARDLLAAIGDRPLLAVGAGMIFTMLLQSSSASIMMIQVLAVTGAFGTDYVQVLRVSIPFILGDNIGTTITAQIAAARTNLSGRRAAMAHTVFNVVGVAVVLPLVYVGWFADMVRAITPWELSAESVALHIAVAHSVFNVANSLAFLPLVGVLEKLVVRIVPGRRGEPVTLERHLLATPPLAMNQARREIVRMARTARGAVADAVAALREDDRGRIAQVARQEDAVDEFQTQITRYLADLSQRKLSRELAGEVPVLLHTVNDLERVSDHATNIAEVAEKKLDERYSFSPAAGEEMSRIRDEIETMLEQVVIAIEATDADAARRVLEHEVVVNRMQVEFRRAHTLRVADGTCPAMAGLLFIDYVDNMEKIGDHLTNIAQGVIGGLQWSEKPSAEPEDGDP